MSQDKTAQEQAGWLPPGEVQRRVLESVPKADSFTMVGHHEHFRGILFRTGTRIYWWADVKGAISPTSYPSRADAADALDEQAKQNITESYLD